MEILRIIKRFLRLERPKPPILEPNPQELVRIERERKNTAEKRFDDEKNRHAQEEQQIREEEKKLLTPDVQKKFQEEVIDGKNKNAAYLRKVTEDNARWNTIKILIEQNPAVADIILKLATSGRSVHGNPTELLLLGQQLLFEANKAEKNQGIQNAVYAVQPFMGVMLEQMEKTLQQEFRERLSVEGRNFNIASWIAEKFDFLDTETIQQMAHKPEEAIPLLWSKIVDKLHTPLEEVTPDPLPGKSEPWTKIEQTQVSKTDLPVEFEKDLDKFWSGITGKEGVGKFVVDEAGNIVMDGAGKPKIEGNPMSLREIETAMRALQKLESEAYPKVLIPDTKAYNRTVQAIREETEKKLDVLVARATQILASEGPAVQVMSKEDFLKAMDQPGRFGALLLHNPEIADLLLKNDDLEGMRFREQVFLKIHAAVLTQRRDNTQDTFGLYERSDFSTFINHIRSGMKNKDHKLRKTYGQIWSDHFVNLSNAIRLSRDIDFNASQPGANTESFARIMGLWQNEYVLEALSIPAVEQAFRAYETALRVIKDANDGYIPPALVEYMGPRHSAHWDDMTQNMLMSWVEQGVVLDAKRMKERGFLEELEKDGQTVKLEDGKATEEEKRENEAKAEEKAQESKDRQEKYMQYLKEDAQGEGLAMSMYLTLAKGFGLSTLRYLEMFANSRVPGFTSGLDPFALEGGHSIAGYESTAASMDLFNTVIKKFAIGRANYFALMNMLVPESEKKRPLDAKEAVNAYLAYRDGTFADKYGDTAKRLIDLTNFSKMSSSLGPTGSKWRYFDSTLGWTDKEREALGGPARILLGVKYAGEWAKNYLVINKYKDMYRSQLEADNKKGSAHPLEGPRFEAMWEQYGKSQYSKKINEEVDVLEGKTKSGEIHHTRENKHFHHLSKAYQHAYTARMWVETAMRNPIVVAHNIDVEMPVAGGKGGKKTKLHNLIVEDVLGISPEDVLFGSIVEEKDGEVVVRRAGGKFASPNEEQIGYTNEIMGLETDLAAVREVAIREKRDLTEADFRTVISRADAPRRQKNALRYWELCRQAILGDTRIGRAEDLYNAFGLTYQFGDKKLLGNYSISTARSDDKDWKEEVKEKIEGIYDTIDNENKNASELTIKTKYGEVKIGMLMNEKFVRKDWDWMFGTDDIALREIDFANLGSRSWFRRASGDSMAHYNGGNEVMKYLNMIGPHADMDGMAEQLRKIVDAYSGEDPAKGHAVAGRFAYATSKFYAFDWRHFGSAAELMYGRVGTDSWMADERYKWHHTLHRFNVFPPSSHMYEFGGTADEYTLHTLEKLSHATVMDVMKQYALWGVLAMMLMTFYSGLTAKVEGEA